MTAPDYGLTKPSYTIAETAGVLSISQAMLFKMMRLGKIRSRKIGCRTIFLRADLETFLGSLPTVGTRMGGEQQQDQVTDNARHSSEL